MEISNMYSKSKKFKFCSAALIFAFCIFNFTGCAAITEGTRGFLGISTRSLEKARKSAIVKELPYDYFTSYTKILDALKSTRSRLYEQDVKNHMIALYVSESDTTAVGVFFEEIGQNNTRIEISSPSTYAREFIAAKIFELLEKDNAK